MEYSMEIDSSYGQPRQGNNVLNVVVEKSEFHYVEVNGTITRI